MHCPALRLLPLCLAVAGAVHAKDTSVVSWEFCPNPQTLPVFKTDLPKGAEREKVPTDISAENLQYLRDQSTRFSGNVELQRGDQWLGTEALTYEHDSERFVTDSDVRYQDNAMRLIAKRAEGNQKTDVLSLESVQYQLETDNGNGQAELAVIEGKQGRLSQATYSTCPPANRQWEFSASEIGFDQARGVGTAHNARLKIGGVPVLWLPYVQFPTDDRRRSGILMPKLGYDQTSGLDFTLPIYLNLAPNYDATLLPRIVTRRGLMLGGEFRYLTPDHRGEVLAHWLGDDDLYGRDRHLLVFKHSSRLTDRWQARANINDVSDDEYFQDFGENGARTSITLLGSDVGLYGRGLGWSASLTAERWQIANPLLPPGSEPYRRLPRSRFDWEKPVLGWLDLGLSAEAVRFDHESRAGGSRVDLRPYLRAPFGGSYWFLTPTLAWRHTSYSLDSQLALPGGERSPSRSLPIASLDAGLVFERDLQWRGSPFVQTLEPRLFYLNVPYRDQDDLPLFDSQPLSFGWPGLFRDNRFGGADRQGDANQATLALSSRIFGANDGRERVNASLGRVFYFDPPRVSLPGEPLRSDNGSSYVAELTLAVSDRWDLGVAQQWEPDTSRTELSALRSQWRYGQGGVINASYRYRDQLLEQTDLSFVVPINAQWRVVGRWNYSLRDNTTLETLAGFEWKSCCVALRVLGRQYIRSFDAKENIGLYVELELNGVGSFGRDTAQLIDNAILGYSR